MLTVYRVKKELARLERNKERRHAREKAKGKQLQRASTIEPGDAGSPSATPAPSIEKPTGTTRKCANCGQTGHIKTNKKLCPKHPSKIQSLLKFTNPPPAEEEGSASEYNEAQ